MQRNRKPRQTPARERFDLKLAAKVAIFSVLSTLALAKPEIFTSSLHEASHLFAAHKNLMIDVIVVGTLSYIRSWFEHRNH